MPRRATLTGVAAALAIAAVLVTGCGGSSRLSPAEFAKRADAECTQADKSAPQTAPRTAKQAVRYTQQQIDGRTALDAKLRKLSPPKSESGTFASFNAGTAELLGVLRQQGTAAQKNDENRYAKLNDVFSKIAQAREKLAAALGFKVCGRSVVAGAKK